MAKTSTSKIISFWINFGLIACVILFIVGIFAPLMTVSKFYVFDNTVSIITSLQGFWEYEEYLLFIIIGGFSIVLPLLKFCMLFIIWNTSKSKHEQWNKRLQTLAKYGKWSMLDVFVVAMFFVAIKLRMIAEIEIHYGLYAFATSVILSMIITSQIFYRVGKFRK